MSSLDSKTLFASFAVMAIVAAAPSMLTIAVCSSNLDVTNHCSAAQSSEGFRWNPSPSVSLISSGRTPVS